MVASLEDLPLPDELPAIPVGWRYESLGDLVEERGVSYGIVQPGSDTGDGVPIVRVNNIRNGRIDTTDMLKVQSDIEAKFRRSRLRGGEVLLTLVGTLGEVAIVPEDLRGWNVARAVGVIPVRDDPGSLWVSICLRSAFIQHCIRTWATTTVQATFNLRDLAKLPIPIPPKETREAIAGVLGALDDKIELNRRMNATLEAVARALFQSWFVDFDPVRRNLDQRGQKSEIRKVKRETGPGTDRSNFTFQSSSFDHLFPAAFQHSELGEIPHGWRLGTLGELVQLRTDRVDATPAKDSTRYIALEDMPSKSIDLSYFQLGSAVNSSITAFRKGDVLFGSMRPYFHKVGLAFFDGITRTTTFVLRPRKDCFRHFALLHFFSDDVVAHSTTASVGTTIPYVRWDSMESYRIPIPQDSLLAAFEKTVSPLVERIAAQGEESRTLATLRDTLLPKLLSGELCVPAKSVLLHL